MGKNSKKVYLYGLKLLSVCDRTEGELIEKFKKKGYEEQEISVVIDKLKQQNYLNDYRFTLNWINMRMERKLFGRERIKQELKNKKVSSEIINSCLTKVDEQTFTFNLKKLLKEKYPDLNRDNLKELRKAYNFIRRRGYSSKDFFKVIELIGKED